VPTVGSCGLSTNSSFTRSLRRPVCDWRLVGVACHHGGNPGEILKSNSHRCYLREVAIEWELSYLKKPFICPWVVSRVGEAHLQALDARALLGLRLPFLSLGRAAAPRGVRQQHSSARVEQRATHRCWTTGHPSHSYVSAFRAHRFGEPGLFSTRKLTNSYQKPSMSTQG